jgi:osmotically-inducible protein OsmY
MPTVEPSLATRATSAIQSSPHLSRRKLHCEASEGRVVVRGTVSTYYQKQMATEALRRLDGVEQIENHLEVAWS